MILEVTVNDLD